MIGCLRIRVRKQPTIALYFESGPEDEELDHKRPNQEQVPTPKMIEPIIATVPQTAQRRMIMITNRRSSH